MDQQRREAFEALCRQEFEKVFGTAYLITGDRDEAADLAQEAFARAYERWDMVAGLDSPAAWLHRVVANLALSWRRRLGARQRAYRAAYEPNRTEEDPSSAFLVSTLADLTPAQRAVVALRFYADMSVGDVALALGKRPGTVRALTSQAMERLRTTHKEVSDENRR